MRIRKLLMASAATLVIAVGPGAVQPAGAEEFSGAGVGVATAQVLVIPRSVSADITGPLSKFRDVVRRLPLSYLRSGGLQLGGQVDGRRGFVEVHHIQSALLGAEDSEDVTPLSI